jgi:hypothetical protein
MAAHHHTTTVTYSNDVFTRYHPPFISIILSVYPPEELLNKTNERRFTNVDNNNRATKKWILNVVYTLLSENQLEQVVSTNVSYKINPWITTVKNVDNKDE